MVLYPLVLFLHVLGALTLFVALALDWTSLHFLRRSSTLQLVRLWFGVLARLRSLYLTALGGILLPGIYMAVALWGWTAWIVVAFVGVLFLAALGMTVTRSRMMLLGPALAAESEPLSPGFLERLQDSKLWMSIHLRGGVAVGIIFLMTVRPGLAGSLIAVGLSAGLGLGLASRSGGQARRQAMSATQ